MNKGWIAAATGITGLVLAPTALTAQDSASTSAAAPAGAVDPIAVQSLVTSINAGIAALPADAPQSSVEAAIAFAIDQSRQSTPVILAALDQISASASSSKLKLALTSIRDDKTRIANVQSGTGAIAGGPDVAGILAAGPSISVSPGGGSSDYTVS